MDSIPLARALLCLDCDVIYDLPVSVCPKCGGRAALHLGRVILPLWQTSSVRVRVGESEHERSERDG
jgi:hypothetical protein